jgi:hypothetical protein
MTVDIEELEEFEEEHQHEVVAEAVLSKEFVLAGKATFTVSSAEQKKHFVYGVNYHKFPDGGEFFFVYCKEGKVWKYLGILNPVTGQMRTTAKTKFPKDAREVKVAIWTLKRIWDEVKPSELPAGVQIQHMGACGRCGRALIDPISITKGIGPICRKAIKKARGK